jgi:hypothetical protein
MLLRHAHEIGKAMTAFPALVTESGTSRFSPDEGGLRRRGRELSSGGQLESSERDILSRRGTPSQSLVTLGL